MRQVNRADEIHFIYESRLLNVEAREKLVDFCAKYRLTLVDVTEIIHTCTQPLELKLVEMYQDEILNLGRNGGNPAVASDILRLLSPIYGRGIYTDFDVFVDTRKLPHVIEVKAPLLLRISSFILKENSSLVRLSVNNETWCVVNQKAALPYIQRIQATAIQLSGIQSAFIPAASRTYIAQNEADFIGSVLTKLSQQQNARQMRRSIHRLCDSNILVYRLMLDLKNFLVEGERLFFKGNAIKMNDELLSQIAQNLRYEYSAKLALVTRNRRQKLERCILDRSDKPILDANRHEIFDQLIDKTIIGTTGSDAYMFGIFGQNQFSRIDAAQKVYPFALETYGLQHIFYSTNGYPLGATEAEREQCMRASVNDNSWRRHGEQAMFLKADTMQRAALSIQRFFRAHAVDTSSDKESQDNVRAI